MEVVEDVLKEKEAEEERLKGILKSVFKDWTLNILEEHISVKQLQKRFEFVLNLVEVLGIKEIIFEVGDVFKTLDQSYSSAKFTFNEEFIDLYFLLKRWFTFGSTDFDEFWRKRFIPKVKNLVRMIPFPVEFKG